MNERAKKLNVENYAISKNHTPFADAKITKDPSRQRRKRKRIKYSSGQRVGDNVWKIAHIKNGLKNLNEENSVVYHIHTGT